ncbi:MAG: hypothetical protein ACKVTZ_05505 [Bacteroidia bacterium]
MKNVYLFLILLLGVQVTGLCQAKPSPPIRNNLNVAGCGSVIATTNSVKCNNDGTYTIILSLRNTPPVGGGGCDVAYSNLVAVNGQINSVQPPLPLTITSNTSQIITINYAPNTGITTANLILEGTWRDRMENCVKLPIDVPLPPCVCEVCEQLKPTFDAPILVNQANSDGTWSITVKHPFRIPMQNMTQIKAELTYFSDKYKNEECMKCNKNSKTFGNFISGQLIPSTGSTMNGLFIPIPNGQGNTHHSLYWIKNPPNYLPTSGTFFFNISAPPLSSLSCCGDDICFVIRYTVTNEKCETCTFTKEYCISRNMSNVQTKISK